MHIIFIIIIIIIRAQDLASMAEWATEFIFAPIPIGVVGGSRKSIWPAFF